MDDKYLAYETLVASRETISWTAVSAVAGLVSACASIVAAIAALFALKGWKAQERAREYKNLNVAVFRYQSAMSTAPYLIESKKLEPEQLQMLKRVFDALDIVYESTLAIHDKNMRSEASALYSDLAEIHNSYTSGKLNRLKAIETILLFRLNNELLNPPHKK